MEEYESPTTASMNSGHEWQLKATELTTIARCYFPVGRKWGKHPTKGTKNCDGLNRKQIPQYQTHPPNCYVWGIKKKLCNRPLGPNYCLQGERCTQTLGTRGVTHGFKKKLKKILGLNSALKQEK